MNLLIGWKDGSQPNRELHNICEARKAVRAQWHRVSALTQERYEFVFKPLCGEVSLTNTNL